MKTIAIAGTFDSKGEEFLYVKKLVEKLGLQTYIILVYLSQRLNQMYQTGRLQRQQDTILIKS